MASLKKQLLKKGFHCIPMKVTTTNHLKIKAVINGVKGNFIVDTGASNTCIDFKDIATFHLTAEATETKAAGAGNSAMDAKVAEVNLLKIKRFKIKKLTIGVFDLSHINTALAARDSKPVDGIIGADVLQKGRAIIDYKKSLLFLRA